MQPLVPFRPAFQRTMSRRGDAAKVIIITVCAFVMILLLLCGGAGYYAYVLFQRNLGRAVVQSPAEIRQLTTEITDIEIPPEFRPTMGSAIFGMKTVNYEWKSTGTPKPVADPLPPMLHMMEFAADSDEAAVTDYTIQPYQQADLKEQYVDFEHHVQDYTIRGQVCQFLFVTGRPKEGAFDDEEMLMDEAAPETAKPEATAVTSESVEEKPADAATVVDGGPVPDAEAVVATEVPVKALPAVRTVTGEFPGKSGSATITIRVPVEGSDEDLLKKIIQSIH